MNGTDSPVKEGLGFVKMNPSGNTTLLITDPVARDRQLPLALVLATPEYLAVDQVGFLEKPEDAGAEARLQMMGGEFCGNASRALAAYLLQGKGGVTRGSVILEVSGSDTLVEAFVEKRTEGCWWTEVAVPVPRTVRTQRIPLGNEMVEAVYVELPGIDHLVLEGIEPSRATFEYLERNGYLPHNAEARGVMFWNRAARTLTPLVAVGASDPVREGSCGSGSIAVATALAMADRTSIRDLQLHQPGGELLVTAEYGSGGITRALIKGTVDMIATGRVSVPAHDSFPAGSYTRRER